MRNWRRYTPREAGGCMTPPLEDCKFQPHPPILTVDFEADTYTLFYFAEMGPERTTPPTWEEASALSQQTFTSVPDFPAMTPEQAAAEREAPEVPQEIGPEELQTQPEDEEWLGLPESDDTVPPALTATAPAVDATGVETTTQVKAVFGEPVWEPAISLRDATGTPVQSSPTLSADRKELVLTPVQPLAQGTRYTVEVREAYDQEGNTMTPYSWSFTTVFPENGSWSFDEGTGSITADSSGRGHHATLNGTATWTQGKSGDALTNTVEPAAQNSSVLHDAAAQGKQIEVTEKTTETSITYAQPDGKTFTTEIAAGPVRTRQNGKWVPIDTTLVEQNGALKPKAIASDVAVAITNGGAGAFVSMTAADGQSYALRWPTALPKPAISKNTATFTDAAGKGADLVVTVLPTGFRHDVVLRERPAKPLEIRIGVQTDGLSLSEGKGGRLLLTQGKSKKLIASAPQPVMWDASSKASQTKDRLAKGGSLKARHAKVATDVVVKDGRTELVLKPDHAFLTDPATQYPVRVDPTTTLPFNNDVEVTDSSDAEWPADPTAWYLTAGRMYGSLSRIYLRFDTASLAGQTVSDAKLSLLNIDAPGCGTQVGPGAQVRRVTAAWDENTLHWGNKPAATTEDASTNRQAFGQSCSEGVAPLEWNVTGIAQDWAAGAANHGLMLRHPNEANTADNYRVFPSAEETSDFNRPPTLTITTTGPASTPAVSALAITPAQSTGTTTTATSLTPQLAATVSDVIGGNLSGEFEIEHDPAATGQGTGQIWAGASAAVASGNPATVTVPSGKLADGWKVRWRARAVNAAASSTSAWSAWQQATIDVPNPAVGSFQVTPAQQVDGATVTTSLTPALHTTVTDPAGQPLRTEFEVEHDPAATGQGSGQVWTGAVDNVASGSQATVTVPANTLTDGWKVRWRTRAINPATTLGSPWSDWQTLTVDVPDPVSEPAVGALQVTPSQQVDGTTITPTRTPSLLAQVSDPAGGALRAEVEVEHDPAAPAGQGSGQIWTGSADNVPAGTQAAIAVPADTLADAWKVRWRARAVSSTAASAWSDWQPFTVSLPKPTATGLTITPSKVVDGATVSTTLTPTLQATVTHPMGQALRAEAEIEHDPAASTGQGSGQIWTGSVDNVASGTQASLTVPAGKLTDGWKVRWRLRAVTEQASSAWSDWQQVTVDVTQPGEEPLAQTTGPVIHTDQSFTAAAWLRWSDKDGDYTVVEQKGTHQAPFRLGNTADHGLVFTFTSADTADATIEGVLSDVEPPVNEWFHLSGVYDAAAKTATLYLNGALIKSAPVSFTAWNTETAMTLGTSMVGDLDEVRIYQHALTAGDVNGLYTSTNARITTLAEDSEQATPESKDLEASPPATKATEKQSDQATAAASEAFPYQRISTRACENLRAERFPESTIGPTNVNEYWRAYTYCTSRHYSWNIFSDSRRTRMGGVTVSATAVIKSYIGGWKRNGEVARQDVTNPGVHHPRDIDVWVRIDKVKYSESFPFAPMMDADDADVSVEIKATSSADNGASCKLTNSKHRGADGGPTSKITKDADEWEADSQVAGKDEYWFTYRSAAQKVKTDPASEAYDGISYCTIRPYITVEKGWFDVRNTVHQWIGIHTPTVPMWDMPKDSEDESKDKAPALRCDLSDTYTAYYGSCIFNRVDRVYRISAVDQPGRKPVSLVAEHLWHTREHPDDTWPEETTTDNPRKPITGKYFPGHWGRNPLHFLGKRVKTDDGVSARGRNKTMKDRICNLDFTAAQKAGKQCDEYPFNTAQEGAGQRTNDHDPKTQVWNFSIRPVDTTHNGNAGTHKLLFEAHYRLFHGDPFWVSVHR
ncbi:DNRLRE domain-containing protein [Planobispora rosea]|uniref:DNRLRE domain-containing protein n=1 Tax=Planobispora rosea TaxID=35762 RepID=UPI001940B541|nr:DNRLRE domain-containing protein [Planobispora rosea]